MKSEEEILEEVFQKNEFSNELILDQWKKYVDMADNISNRRNIANNFFLTSISVIVLAIGFLVEFEKYFWLLPTFIIGMLFSLNWWNLIKSYKALNGAKFKIINKIEEFLPIRGFSKEWELLSQGEEKKIYWPLTHIEILIPASLSLFFLISFILFSIYLIAKSMTVL